MKLKIIISVFLMISSQVAFSQEGQPEKNKAKERGALEQSVIKVTIMYPFLEGKKFDLEYYKSKHMPMVAAILGSNLLKYTIEKGIGNGIPDSPLPFVAIGTFYVKDLGQYQKAIQPKRAAIRADFANYTDINPVIFISELVK
jgi:uncharacterized protein (TIGR02118 family)